MSNLIMELNPADSPNRVSAIVEKTIRAIYPHYYPAGAVQFFLDLHSEERIRSAMDSEEIYLATVQEKIVGTEMEKRLSDQAANDAFSFSPPSWISYTHISHTISGNSGNIVNQRLNAFPICKINTCSIGI